MFKQGFVTVFFSTLDTWNCSLELPSEKYCDVRIHISNYAS